MVAEHTHHLIFRIFFFPYRSRGIWPFLFHFSFGIILRLLVTRSFTGTIIHLHAVWECCSHFCYAVHSPGPLLCSSSWLSSFLFNCMADESQEVVSACLNIYSVSNTTEDPLPKRFSSKLSLLHRGWLLPPLHMRTLNFPKFHCPSSIVTQEV